jgi:putative peptide zinc metalloprotease protein
VPGDQPATAPGAPADPAPAAPQSWVFPVDKPLAPGEGDNQSMAVNTTDNTVQYDVAFALVWIDDDSPAMNKNEAYAFASCTGCAAVAVGFQVVLVTGDNHVAVPQNISAAVNSDCVNCLTYALATQLFVTLDGPLSEAGPQQISALWREIASFGTHITEVPLSEIRSRLTAYETQILEIIEKEQGPLAGTPAATPTATPSGGPSPSGTVTPSDLASPTAGDPTASTSSDPTAGSSSDAPSGTSTDATTPAPTAATDPPPTSSADPSSDTTPAAAAPGDPTATP